MTMNFTPGVVIPSAWLNDVDAFVYQGVGLPMVSVKSYGALGDGSTDDTAAINAATLASITSGQALFFPAGTYIATQLNVVAGMKWVGESSLTSILKLKSGTNGDFVVSATTSSADDIWIEHLRFDGNHAGNTSGNTLTIKGARPTMIDVVVVNSAENAIITDWAGPSFRTTGSEGHFSHITIDSPQKSGWLHSGPSDSHFDDIIIIDAGLETDNSYYGMILMPTGLGGTGSNGRFNNLHHWNRSSTTNTATVGVYVGFGGNTFTNCHFEGGHTCLNVAADINVFESCDYYAPRGSYAVTMAGGTNKLSGIVGATYFATNRNYTGLYLVGASNIIDLVVVDEVTPITFGDASAGGNIVKIAGYVASPAIAYTGTYATNDVIDIVIQGTGGGVLHNTPVTTSSYSESIQTISNAQALSNGVNKNLNTITLGAGTWDVQGIATFHPGATTNIGVLKLGISTASATYGADQFNCQVSPVAVPIVDQVLPSPLGRIVLTESTTIYLVTTSYFSVSTLTAFGSLTARLVTN